MPLSKACFPRGIGEAECGDGETDLILCVTEHLLNKKETEDVANFPDSVEQLHLYTLTIQTLKPVAKKHI